ncbi:hypothetical protein [Streptomyces lomondensis]|uniref:Amidase n=1 Tax=Streptomyces lomondensis TaxID=68229 RepID=A0ABQ2XA95_9ACTN|nr:hypothetical protein [Streptomyces lomondensis]MCF0077071.1 hypothetical protein [Streptomyces lomondensis]GGX06936.1 hypothetical protein GCM10010383_41240 [Streptomyces lomondensis]
MTALTDLDATELARRVRTREVSSREVVRAHLDRVAAVDPDVRAVLTVLGEQALTAADRADAAVARVGPSARCTAFPSPPRTRSTRPAW